MMPGQPPQAAPQMPQGAPQAGPGKGQPQSIEQMVSVIGTSLSDFAKLLSKAGEQIPPEFGQRAQALNQGFQDLIQDLSTGGAPAPSAQPKPQGQAVPQEAGSQGVPRL